MSAGNPPTRRRGTRGGTGGGLPRQALALMLLVSLAFAAAVYMGSKHPYIDSTGTPTQLSMMVVPLQPGAGGIPTGTRFGNATATATATPTTTATATATATASGSASGPGSPSPSASASPSPGPGPFAGTAVEDYAIGGAGILLPFPHHTADFSSDQVLRALKIVYNYLYASSLDSTVLTGAGTSSVKQVLAPAQYKQFEDSLNNPRDDQQHDVTGWLVRFDPSKVRLVAADGIRVRGDLEYKQLDPGTLEVTSDYTFVYALTQAPAASASPSPSASASLSPSPSATAHGSASPVSPVSATAAAQPPIVLFTVRRAITYRFTADDLNAEQVELVDSVVQAGPMSCDADTSSYLQPLFPAAATTPAADRHPAASGSSTPQAAPGPGPSVDPFNHTRPAWDVCGVLTGPTLQHEPPLPSQAGTG